jgi:hypothetical protein
MVQKKNKGKYGNTNVHHLKDVQRNFNFRTGHLKLSQTFPKKTLRKLPPRISKIS